MPEQALYTSSESGLVPGKSGYCIVAATEGLDNFAYSLIEKISEFSHEHSKKNGYSKILSFQNLNFSGKKYYVLTRSVDSGFDFSGRTNFLSHHLLFEEHEIVEIPNPLKIFKHWHGWIDRWEKTTGRFRRFDSDDVIKVDDTHAILCTTWKAVTGCAEAAFIPIYSGKQFAMDVTGINVDDLLDMIHETIILNNVTQEKTQLPACNWNTTFSTSVFSERSEDRFDWRFQYGNKNKVECIGLRDPNSVPRITEYEKAVLNRTACEPIILFDDTGVECFAGQILNISVRCLKGFPVPEISWYASYNGGAWDKIDQSGNTISLIFKQIGMIELFCVVENRFGKISSPAKQVRVVGHESEPRKLQTQGIKAKERGDQSSDLNTSKRNVGTTFVDHKDIPKEENKYTVTLKTVFVIVLIGCILSIFVALRLAGQ